MAKHISRLTVKRGKYGKSKVKAFHTLANYRANGVWVGLRELCVVTGIKYHSLGRTMSRWVDFGYVSRRPLEFGGTWEYRVEDKGLKWLKLAEKYLPHYKNFRGELDAWQAPLTDERASEIVNLSFKEFVKVIDELVDLQDTKKEVGAAGG